MKSKISKFRFSKIAFIFFAILSINSTFGQDSTKFFVRDIIIIGNEITKDFVILNEIPFAIGDSVFSADLDFARERIYSLGIFNSIDITKSKGNDNGAEVIVVVREGWTIFPMPYFLFQKNSIKYSTYGFNFLYKNFRGRNETISINFALGYDPNFFLSYQNPNFLERNTNLALEIGYSPILNKNREFLQISNENFKYHVFYFGGILGKRFTSFFQANLLFGFRQAKLNSEYSSQYFLSKNNRDNIPSIGFNFRFDSRDLPLYATSGNFAELVYTHYGFGIDNINYSSINLDFRKYYIFGKYLFVRSGLQTRFLVGESSPIYDLSYLGYLDYIRGNSKAYQCGRNKSKFISEIGIPIIDNFIFIMDLPLVPKELSTSKTGMNLVGFYDFGKTFDDFGEISKNKMIYGYGFGVNIFMLPYNILRFIYGFNDEGKGEFIFETGFSL